MADTVDIPLTPTEKTADKSRSEYNKAKDAYLSQKQSKYKPAKY